MAAHSAAHPAPAEHRVALAALWFGLFGAPTIWSIQLMLNYALVAHACYPASEPLSAPVFGGVRGTVIAASVVALAIALGAAATAWRSWRATRQEHRGGEAALLEVGEGRTRFMALAGMMTSATFLLVILAHAATLLFVAPCAG
jgi:hypothetical protein